MELNPPHDLVQGGIYKPPFDRQSCLQRQASTMLSSASAAEESSTQKGTSGNISSVFDQSARVKLHPRFSELKKTIWKDSMIQSWTQVLEALKEKAEQVGSLGSKAGGSIKHPSVCAKYVVL